MAFRPWRCRSLGMGGRGGVVADLGALAAVVVALVGLRVQATVAVAASSTTARSPLQRRRPSLSMSLVSPSFLFFVRTEFGDAAKEESGSNGEKAGSDGGEGRSRRGQGGGGGAG